MSIPLSLTHIMQGDIVQLAALFERAAAPASAAALRKNTHTAVFAELFSAGYLDAALTPLVQQLQSIFMQVTTEQLDFYTDATHPLRLLFRYLLHYAATWYPRDAKPNQQFYTKLNSVMPQFIQWANDINNKKITAQLQITFEDLQHWTDAEEKRAAMLVTRLCESEINNLKIITAECRVLDVINGALANQRLPTLLHQNIITTLKNELQHSVFTTGEKSTFLQSWSIFLPIIRQSFCEDNSAEIDQQLYRKVPAILHELERSLTDSVSNQEQYRQFVEDLSQCLLFALQKKPLECTLFLAMAYPDNGNHGHTRVVDSVLQRANTLQQHDWILFSGENQQIIRCKLALKNSQADTLLFVDRTGRKVMIKNNKDMSLCLTAGIAKPLNFMVVEDVIAKQLQQLISLQINNDQLLQQKQQIEIDRKHTQAALQQQSEALAREQKKLAQAQAEADKIALQLQQLTAQTEAHRAAANKAMAEARALAQQKQRREQQQALQQQAELARVKSTQAAQQLLQQEFAQQQIQALNVGAWVEIKNDTQHTLRCKLAVIIAASGKYIFVDNLGRKIAEYQREQLIADYLEEKILLINNGDKFEDQLVKVIRSLRKDIS